jgi:hypothetical protein
MVTKMVVLGVVLVTVVGSAACGVGGGGSANAGEGGETVVAAGESTAGAVAMLTDDYTDALPVSTQLAVGTLMLGGTASAVTAQQAGALLPNWQMLEALQSSGTAAAAELDAVLSQIQGGMKDEQLAAIKEMGLTWDNITELAQEQGMRMVAAGRARGAGTGQPPAGVDIGAGNRPRGGFGVLAGGEDLSPEEQQTAIAERMNAFMTGMVVSMLEARAAGESWEIAAPNQEMVLQSELIATIAEATGLDQQDIRTQTREGQTLRVIAVGNGADLNAVVAQVVATDTERVNQAVSDGSLEQADADQWFAGLEARVKEMLEGTLQVRDLYDPSIGSTQ